MKSTTIKVKKDTWKGLNSLKNPGDTFNDVLQRLLDNMDKEQD